ncbi:MAG: translation initiation factor eIF-1A [Candidatus Micrarchaeaceae archaeon]
MQKKQGSPIEQPKLILPRNGELLGVVTRSLGATNFIVFCSDKNERTCSIPGRLKRRFWIKEGDVVLVKPWVVQTNERGDIVWRYSVMDKSLLKQKGFEIPV